MAWRRIDAEPGLLSAADTPAERQLVKSGQAGRWRWLGLGVLLTIGVSSMLLAQSRPETAAPDEALTRRLELMLRTMRIARDRHVLKPGNPQLLNGAIRGLLDKLDPEAVLYTPEELRREQVTGPLPRGTGIVVQKLAVPPRGTGPAFRIVGTSDGSPAARAGLRAGDLIAYIDGRPTAELSVQDIRRNRLEGQAPGFVELSVIRGPTGPALDLTLEREPRQTPHNTLTWLPGGAALLRIAAIGATFRSPATPNGEFGLEQAPLGDVTAVIIDLRDVAGGTRDAAIAFADAFLAAGTIVTVESRGAKGAETFKARAGDIARGKPIAILVNAGTAKAAEIVAAALHANKRAMLFGTATPGRGADYRIAQLGNGRGSILLKVERYISPTGQNLDKSGIKPDIEISPAKDAAASACREIDRPGESSDGQCERRPVREDTALQAALAYLTVQPIAAKP